jgi:hypothetical protein
LLNIKINSNKRCISTKQNFPQAFAKMSVDESLRKGKWTPDEENYANKIIYLFNQGLLPIPAGTTLRGYLSEKLHCDPMRITKKYAGASCIGKQVFTPCEKFLHTIGTANVELQELETFEQLFLQRLGLKIAKSAAELEFLSNIEGSANNSPRSTPRSSRKAMGGNRPIKKIMSETDIFSNAINRHRNAKFGDRRRASSFAMIDEDEDGSANYNPRRKRSQSMADYTYFNVDRYTESDLAASDLLIQFSRTDSSEDLMELAADSQPSKQKEFKMHVPKKSNLFSAGPSAGAELTTGIQAKSMAGLGLQLPWLMKAPTASGESAVEGRIASGLQGKLAVSPNSVLMSVNMASSRTDCPDESARSMPVDSSETSAESSDTEECDLPTSVSIKKDDVKSVKSEDTDDDQTSIEKSEKSFTRSNSSSSLWGMGIGMASAEDLARNELLAPALKKVRTH